MSSPLTDEIEVFSVERCREAFLRTRAVSDRIARSLSPEDCQVQSMTDASPVKWHLAHTTWFFETFILNELEDYRPYHEQYAVLFNSYYNSVGDQFPRPQRGLMTRPSLEEIWDYRDYVEESLLTRMEQQGVLSKYAEIIELGIHHEQQHQELMLTDIKYTFFCNPLLPAYCQTPLGRTDACEPDWLSLKEGTYEIGHAQNGFAYDNESPAHRVYLQGSELSTKLVTNGEFLEFIEDGGYQRPEFWLSLGWQEVQQHGWQAPLYWIRNQNDWSNFTLGGLQPLEEDWPVCHLSFFEADAFARWSGYRLPTEFEWEAVCRLQKNAQVQEPRFLDDYLEQDLCIHPTGSPQSLLGEVWQWTSSSYAAYPGYRADTGALGEYNGKFMCNQYVLRGGSVATDRSHIRTTYRNFFSPASRWQFSGLRVARDLN